MAGYRAVDGSGNTDIPLDENLPQCVDRKSISALPTSFEDLVRDYKLYLEDDIDAFGWFLISDESKLECYSRVERFWIGLYSLMVGLSIGTCISSRHVCHRYEHIVSTEESWSHPIEDSTTDKMVFYFAASGTSFIYEFVFLIPLMRYILKRKSDDSGVFSRSGCSGECCHAFIYVPTIVLAVLSCGFLTATQKGPPSCEYSIFTGPLNWHALLYGLSHRSVLLL